VDSGDRRLVNNTFVLLALIIKNRGPVTEPRYIKPGDQVVYT
jgi:hypothetical protein